MRAYARDALRLEFNGKTQVAPLAQGVDYLGFHFYVGRNGRVVRTLRQSAKRRVAQRVALLRQAYSEAGVPFGDWALPAEAQTARSLVAHLAHGDTRGLSARLGLGATGMRV